METSKHSADAEPGGSQTITPQSESRKFSPVVSGILRDAKDTIQVIRDHNIPLSRLPHNPHIEDIEGETTLFLNQLLGTGDGGAVQVRVSLNGKAVISEQPVGATDAQPTSADLQDLVDAMPKDTSGMRLIALTQQILGRLQTAALRIRPSVSVQVIKKDVEGS